MYSYVFLFITLLINCRFCYFFFVERYKDKIIASPLNQFYLHTLGFCDVFIMKWLLLLLLLFYFILFYFIFYFFILLFYFIYLFILFYLYIYFFYREMTNFQQ